MFTGIIEEKGKITSMNHTSKHAIELVVKGSQVIRDIQLGDSIAINGICLTVTSFDKHNFAVDVMPETFKTTSLGSLKIGSAVNLERAMAANGRFGGHFVSGHVDGLGTIIRKQYEENAIYFDIEIQADLAKYVTCKGSIAVDGVSLTVFKVKNNIFKISLIPHTALVTILGKKNTGDIVNIECDMVMKHVEHLLVFSKKEESLSTAFLQEHGFIPNRE
ncbi:riboflavin synthase [Virgibacillus dokdonensis]|uniref:Riboflavin synthase n=1 Tax=Virgibacillus dokdonensis TaxID=302167 RepID=A0A3E0WUI8_9BACI|nr:riboflavin synthase [Virgibacillus dokdonensis]RFA36049.1 riboflavin synthase [Virgibacillus dokdonensis]